jgi:glutamate-1-semialdehyde 2,1-aminomutase
MKSSKQLFEEAKTLVPGGVHSPVRGFKGLDRSPVYFTEGKGAILKDVQGKEYIDYCQSFGPNILGHRDDDVSVQLNKIINKVWTLGAAEPYSVELGHWIKNNIPWAEKSRFVNSGTEAVMSALRLARGHTKKDLILKFDGCYHGHVDSMLVKAGSGLAGETSSSSAGVSDKVSSQTLIAPLNNPSVTYEIIQRHKDNLAAVIIEPLPANNGLLIQSVEFLRNLRQWTKDIGALLIFDEVISGFRVDIQGMAGKLNITPDLVTYGKIMGGGFPVGCYAGKKEIMDNTAPLGNVYQAGTLSANPIGMVAGLATLQKIKEQKVIPELENRTSYFAREAQALFHQYDLPYYVSHYQSLFWIHANKEQNLSAPDQITQEHVTFFKEFFLYLLDNGIYLAPHAYEISFMSYAHTHEILDKTLSVISDFCKNKRK